jgi:formylglycine-generating enzyme required for sulfatase activity
VSSCCSGTPKDIHFLASPTIGAADSPASSGAEIEYLNVAAGSFLMGSEDLGANPLDNEGPIQEVSLPEFEISATPITNAQFAAFITETGYATEAEQTGWSFVFQLLVAEGVKIIGQSQVAPWWLGVEGTSWRCPIGGQSDYRDFLDHPVVHVSYQDALAFCEWAKTCLPTEAQWEKAARGGLESNRYPWGNSLLVSGQWQCNIFQGEFPERNSLEDGYFGTSPVKSFSANGFGGYDFAGNVWEWTQSGFDKSKPFDSNQEFKVTRGGSYLCHDSYCNRYRVGARNKTTLDAIAGNIGFRVVRGRS